MKVQTKTAAEPGSRLTTGADILVRAILREGTDMVFGYPGGAVLPIYDALYRKKVRHILARHEQGAIHAAEGYARVSGKPGVVIATSGPGATNVVTGLMDAIIDSLPLVVFTGQVATKVIGSDAFQEADVIGITAPATKHNFQVRDIRELPGVVREAFYVASTGRPGPVLVDLPKDICAAQTDKVHEEKEMNLPGYHFTVRPADEQVRKLAEAIERAVRPVLLTGAGVLHANASDLLRSFAEKHNLPVVSTLLGLGSFPASHPLFLGMGGMHGTYAANMAISESDLLINIGSRFDDRLTGNLEKFAMNALIAHIDIDPSEIGKNVPVDLPVIGDAAAVLKRLNEVTGNAADKGKWLRHLQSYRSQHPLHYENDRTNDGLAPQRVIEYVCRYTDSDTVITTDVGQHQMWTAQYYRFERPDNWVTSGGLGTMGFGFPAAIGAQVAKPQKPVVAIVGDGGFQMTLQELAVVKELDLPIKIVVLNNHTLGMVRQWQEAFYEKRYAESIPSFQPDFVKLAESYGIRGERVTTEEEADQVIADSIHDPHPVLIDCHVKQMANVFPMVAPGKGLNEMIGV
ncbi:biosynthetic-type acetolactate synthase large subunit [Sporolactobacillus sp. THM7-4]|nr:biosynthetic-type acetolactate synthase large subunit [Sporolactobacillus sp. THM7-4]